MRFEVTSVKQYVALCLSQNADIFSSESFCINFSNKVEPIWKGEPFVGGSKVERYIPKSVRYNVALGRKCSSSASAPTNDCSKAIDGNIDTSFESLAEEINWIEIEFGETKLIRQFVIYKPKEMSEFTVIFMRDDLEKEFQVVFKENFSEKIDQEIIHTRASKMRIRGNDKYVGLQFHDIEVFDSEALSTSRKIDVPLGKLILKEKWNYMTFFQSNQDNTISKVSNVTFLYGELL